MMDKPEGLHDPVLTDIAYRLADAATPSQRRRAAEDWNARILKLIRDLEGQLILRGVVTSTACYTKEEKP